MVLGEQLPRYDNLSTLQPKNRAPQVRLDDLTICRNNRWPKCGYLAQAIRGNK
jgi:hypothetical protein